MKLVGFIVMVLCVALSACASTSTTARSIEQRNADRELVETLLKYCDVSITGSTDAQINASVLPSATAGLRVSLGGNCSPNGTPQTPSGGDLLPQ